jgi:hypothetical protein
MIVAPFYRFGNVSFSAEVEGRCDSRRPAIDVEGVLPQWAFGKVGCRNRVWSISWGPGISRASSDSC